VTDLSDARLTIDLDALAANYRALKAAAGGVEVAPAVKADGYGLGAAMVADRLWAEGARTFYTARLSEGVALRAGLGDREATIYVLDGATPGSAPRWKPPA
jgi:alanine racemase